MINIRSQQTPLLLDHWWTHIVRGSLAIVFGVLATIWPSQTLVALLGMFAAFVILDGTTSIVAAVRNRTMGWPLSGGLLSVAIGTLTLFNPDAAGLAAMLLIGAWAIIRGVLDIAMGIALRKEARSEWLIVASGACSVLFGLLLMAGPATGALALVGLIAGFAMFLGVLLIAAGVRQRKLRRELGAIRFAVFPRVAALTRR